MRGSLSPNPLYFNILTLSIGTCYKKPVTNLWVECGNKCREQE
jgi:hypothetical protein